ncbi:hypothetical protein P3F83_15180 [Mycobacteroides immunogenum]|uniref:hypothetical protein n=1 Tax=Mycobacteroides immunogenum TaxID=83262 RepID=UPI0025B781E9|nr:hypothetical protein [Mycobacteroides immunogenum]WJR31913.1 hypothetical protein P3F83_15180 [Mycobacteroides immunogenum]
MDVQAGRQVVGFGPNLMQVFDSTDGMVMVTAERTNPESPWTIKAAGAEDVTAPDRGSAITAMTDMDLAVSPGTGYSYLVPHGLAEQP